MAYDLTMGGLYAVIPAGVLYDDRLRPAAKLLYGEIVRLAQSSGYCYATNKQLMGVCNLTDKSVSELVSQLRDCGHIRCLRRCGSEADFSGANSGKKWTPNPWRGGPGRYPEKSGYLPRKIGRGYPEKSGGI